MAAAATPCEDVVCIEIESTPAAVTFWANSRADGVTAHLSVVVAGDPTLPPVVTRSLQRGRTEMLKVQKPGGREPKYEHAVFWEWGIVDAIHDDAVSYRLPFGRGNFRLSQGPNGPLTHQGKHAFDFTMPRGTPVCAARAGTVAEVVDGYDEGGPDEKFGPMANVVRIVHDDGTLAAYLHLMRGTMRVRPGQRVQAGTVLAMSGNSGQSSGPHLHFEVSRLRSSGPDETVPVKFIVGGHPGVALEAGRSYSID